MKVTIALRVNGAKKSFKEGFPSGILQLLEVDVPDEYSDTQKQQMLHVTADNAISRLISSEFYEGNLQELFPDVPDNPEDDDPR